MGYSGAWKIVIREKNLKSKTENLMALSLYLGRNRYFSSPVFPSCVLKHVGLISVIKDRIYRLPSEKQKQNERDDWRLTFKDRRPCTTTWPGSWVIENWKRKKYFLLGWPEQSRQD